MTNSPEIADLAAQVVEGRSDAKRAFVALAKDNGYRGANGGYIRDANDDRVAHGWQALASLVASGTVRMVDLGAPQTIVAAHAEALVEDAERFPEVIHHVTRYGNVISCGAAGPVRVEYAARLVTCHACVAADTQARYDYAWGMAIEEDAERDEMRAADDLETAALVGELEQDARTDRNVGPYAQQFDRWVAQHPLAYTPAARMRATEDQAHAEDAARSEAQSRANISAGTAQLLPFIRRAGDARRAGAVNLWDAKLAVIAEDEAEAYQTCPVPLTPTAPCASNVTGNHEYEPAGLIEPAEVGPVCGLQRSHVWHDGSSLHPVPTAAQDREGDGYAVVITVTGAIVNRHAMATYDQAYRITGDRASALAVLHVEAKRMDAARTIATARAPRDEAIDGCTFTGEDWHKPHAYVYDPEVIAERIRTGTEATRCGARRGSDRHIASNGLPPVPADLDDDVAWAMYCATLPDPTDEELATVLAEYTDPDSPEARLAECLRHHRDAVRAFRDVRDDLRRMRHDRGVPAAIAVQMLDALASIRGSIGHMKATVGFWADLIARERRTGVHV